MGLSIRIFDPKVNEWTIYWADTMNPELKCYKKINFLIVQANETINSFNHHSNKFDLLYSIVRAEII